MILLSNSNCTKATTPALQRLATIINKERGVLVEYANRANPSKIHLERRNDFLQSLADSYNLLYQEMQAVARLRFLEKWLIVEKELDLLLADNSIDGVHIKLEILNGDNYGYINL
ncbi:hypothetical protein TH61_08510 [Rufibacter sp. DG15C]|uniref:hypothetical protein n=1 Tax=Rufibacter sp. DG15C TaxID=1379909 RepID=UPI00078E341D|nr:hypothetical protein [Rufibacter sp. DG15C]AMM51209.1 hypothetical protein TH61_08510 [Rufibacter sp. DG15C]